MNKIVSIMVSILFITNLFAPGFVTSTVGITESPKEIFDNETYSFENYDCAINSSLSNPEEPLEGISLHQTLNNSNYETNELISIQYELRGYIEDVDTVYLCDGFSIIGDISTRVDLNLGCRIFNMTLAYDGVSTNPYFSFEVVISEETTICANLYGYLSDYGLFVSKNSFDSAKESSYYYLVECGLLTLSEFNEILQDEYSKLGTETAHVTNNSDLIDPLAAVATPLQITPDTTTVYGELTWIDDYEVSHPMQYNRVEIWDAMRNEKLGTVYTDASGEYSFSYTDTYLTRNIYIKIYPGGANSIVKTGNGGDYVYESSVQRMVFQGSVVTIDWEIDMTSDLGRAFQISQAINVSTKYVYAMNGAYIAPVTVKYPHNIEDQECFYRSSEDTIFICGQSTTVEFHKPYASWDVIMHEYGHHVQEELGITDNPSLRHALNDNLAVRHNSKDLGVRLAWGEAYASVFGGMAQAYYNSSLQNINTVGDTRYRAYNSPLSFDYESTNERKGEACEASIIGVLWDLYDTVAESHDTISFSHQDYWDMITNSGATTFSEFFNYFVNRYSISDSLALGELLSYYKISASDLTVNTSGSTLSFSWSANGTAPELPYTIFDLVIFDENYNEILRRTIVSTSCILGIDDMDTILDTDGTIFHAIVIAYQIATPMTGNYYSETVSFAKP